MNNQTAPLCSQRFTTEHFVLQSANGTTYSEASARGTLYVMALSSSLVAIGFAAGSTDVLLPFIAVVLPALFVLGIFTVVRLVETALESSHCLGGIARIRAYTEPSPQMRRAFSRPSSAAGQKRNRRRSGSVLYSGFLARPRA